MFSLTSANWTWESSWKPKCNAPESSISLPVASGVCNVSLKGSDIVYVDVAKSPDLQKKHNVVVIPTIIIFQDGEEIKRFQADLSFKMAATRKEVQDFIDENGLVKQIISLLGLPAKMIRSDNQVGELRQQRAAAQAEQQQMMQAMQEAKVAKDAAPMLRELNRGTE